MHGDVTLILEFCKMCPGCLLEIYLVGFVDTLNLRCYFHYHLLC